MRKLFLDVEKRFLQSNVILVVTALVGMALVSAQAVRDYLSGHTAELLRFERVIDEHIEHVRDHVQSRLATARVVAAVLRPSDSLRMGVLDGWNERVLPLLPEVLSFVWVSRVPAGDVELARAALRAGGVDQPLILGPAGRGLDTANRTHDYNIILDIHPRTDRNLQTLGLDLASLPKPADALSRALRTGEAAMTAPLELVQLPKVPAVVIYAPVSNRAGPDGVTAGFVGFSYRIETLLSLPPVSSGLKSGLKVLDRDEAEVIHEQGTMHGGRTLSRSMDAAGRTWDFVYDVPRTVERAGMINATRTLLLGLAGLTGILVVFHSLLQLSRRLRSHALAAEVAEERLRMAVAASATGLWEFDIASQRLAWSDECRSIFGAPPDQSDIGFSDFVEHVHHEDRARVRGAMQDAIGKQDACSCEFRVVRPDGQQRWVAQVGRFGRRRGAAMLIGSLRDITEQHRSDEHRELLMKELAHRTKNLMAVVQAIARQTVKTSPNVAEFETRFVGRINALALSIDRLVNERWAGIELADLVREQLRSFSGSAGERLTIDGPPLRVNAQAAQTLGLALHELGTNAVKYGAWSAAAGMVAVSWSVDAGKQIHITWREHGGPPVKEPQTRGFGTTVITQLARVSLQGEVRLDYNAEGLSWTLTCPIAHATDAAELAA